MLSPHTNQAATPSVHILANSLFTDHPHVISGFCRKIDGICAALLENHAAQSGNSLPKFRDNLLVPSSKVKNPFG